MTFSDWIDLDLPIQWSIYVETDDDDADADEWQLDLNAPEGLPDGIYEGGRYWTDPAKTYRQKGIEIKDGKFVPESTAQAVYEIVVGSYKLGQDDWHIVLYDEEEQDIHHYFLEALEWNGEFFMLHMGS